MSNEETRNREFNAFIDIDDSYPKYVIQKILKIIQEMVLNILIFLIF